MALTDKDGNELSAMRDMRNPDAPASPARGNGPLPGQPGGPPVAPAQRVSEEERYRRAQALGTSLVDKLEADEKAALRLSAAIASGDEKAALLDPIDPAFIHASRTAIAGVSRCEKASLLDPIESASILPGKVTYAADKSGVLRYEKAYPHWECEIAKVPDTDLGELEAYLNKRGAEGWEPFQIMPAHSATGNVHYVHMKRRTL